MTLPVRLQLSRKRGFNLQAWSREVNGLEAVNVARPGKWGNPFVCHSDRGPSGTYFTMAPEVAVGSFKVQLQKMGAWFPVPLPWPKGKIPAGAPTTLGDVRRDLVGRNLACWCDLCPIHGRTGKPTDVACSDCAPCHADVLLELANRGASP